MIGQASAEFMVLLGFLSLVFVIIFASSQGYQFYSDKLEAQQEYKEICNDIKFEIETALEMEPVYNRTFYLPEGTYNASISNYEISVEYSYGEVSCYIPANVSGEPIQGKNTILYNETGLYLN